MADEKYRRLVCADCCIDFSDVVRRGPRPTSCVACKSSKEPGWEPEHRACTCCGTEFIQRRPSHLFCSRACAARKREGRDPAGTTYRRQCAHCGISFTAHHRLRTLCSKSCKQDAYLARRKTPAVDVAARVKSGASCVYVAKHCERCGEPWAMRRNWTVCRECKKAQESRARIAASKAAAEAIHRAVGRVKQCRGCGALFCPLYRHGNASSCQSCKETRTRSARRSSKAQRRARQRGVESESFDPMSIFARDKWRCQLCGCKTPREKRGTCADDAPELDHIVPLALGGPHTKANTQCACRKCNGAKGATTVGQLLLFG